MSACVWAFFWLVAGVAAGKSIVEVVVFARSSVWSVVAALFVVFATVLVSQSARAEFVVQSSTVAAYEPGSRYSDDTVFDVPDGKYVKFTKEADGSNAGTFRIAGPYKGTVADYGKCAWYWFGFCGGAGDDGGQSEGSLRGEGHSSSGASGYGHATGATRGLKPAEDKPKEPSE